jgi:thymidylate synthase
VRNGKLISLVYMRSNDAWAGFRNDLAWQKTVATKLAKDLDVEIGDIIWHAGSLHLYESQFYLIEHFRKTLTSRVTALEVKTFNEKTKTD